MDFALFRADEAGIALSALRRERYKKQAAQGKSVKRYPFKSMVIGDAFEASVYERHNARTAAYQFARRHGWRFSTVTKDGKFFIVRVS